MSYQSMVEIVSFYRCQGHMRNIFFFVFLTCQNCKYLVWFPGVRVVICFLLTHEDDDSQEGDTGIQIWKVVGPDIYKEM